MLTGEVVLVTDSGEEVLRAGDAAGFNAGDCNGQNRSNLEAQVLEVGTRAEDDTSYYSDIDMMAPAGHMPAIYTVVMARRGLCDMIDFRLP